MTERELHSPMSFWEVVGQAHLSPSSPNKKIAPPAPAKPARRRSASFQPAPADIEHVEAGLHSLGIGLPIDSMTAEELMEPFSQVKVSAPLPGASRQQHQQNSPQQHPQQPSTHCICETEIDQLPFASSPSSNVPPPAPNRAFDAMYGSIGEFKLPLQPSFTYHDLIQSLVSIQRTHVLPHDKTEALSKVILMLQHLTPSSQPRPLASSPNTNPTPRNVLLPTETSTLKTSPLVSEVSMSAQHVRPAANRSFTPSHPMGRSSTPVPPAMSPTPAFVPSHHSIHLHTTQAMQQQPQGSPLHAPLFQSFALQDPTLPSQQTSTHSPQAPLRPQQHHPYVPLRRSNPFWDLRSTFERQNTAPELSGQSPGQHHGRAQREQAPLSSSVQDDVSLYEEHVRRPPIAGAFEREDLWDSRVAETMQTEETRTPPGPESAAEQTDVPMSPAEGSEGEEAFATPEDNAANMQREDGEDESWRGTVERRRGDRRFSDLGNAESSTSPSSDVPQTSYRMHFDPEAATVRGSEVRSQSAPNVPATPDVEFTFSTPAQPRLDTLTDGASRRPQSAVPRMSTEELEAEAEVMDQGEDVASLQESSMVFALGTTVPGSTSMSSSKSSNVQTPGSVLRRHKHGKKPRPSQQAPHSSSTSQQPSPHANHPTPLTGSEVEPRSSPSTQGTVFPFCSNGTGGIPPFSFAAAHVAPPSFTGLADRKDRRYRVHSELNSSRPLPHPAAAPGSAMPEQAESATAEKPRDEEQLKAKGARRAAEGGEGSFDGLKWMDIEQAKRSASTGNSPASQARARAPTRAEPTHIFQTSQEANGMNMSPSVQASEIFSLGTGQQRPPHLRRHTHTHHRSPRSGQHKSAQGKQSSAPPLQPSNPFNSTTGGSAPISSSSQQGSAFSYSITHLAGQPPAPPPTMPASSPIGAVPPPNPLDLAPNAASKATSAVPTFPSDMPIPPPSAAAGVGAAFAQSPAFVFGKQSSQQEHSESSRNEPQVIHISDEEKDGQADGMQSRQVKEGFSLGKSPVDLTQVTPTKGWPNKHKLAGRSGGRRRAERGHAEAGEYAAEKTSPKGSFTSTGSTVGSRPEPDYELQHSAQKFRERASNLYTEKRYEEAVREFSNALLLAPRNWPERPKLYCNRAAAYIMLHRYEDAIKDCEEAIQGDVGLFKAYTRSGRAYLHMGRLTKAYDMFDQCKVKASELMRQKFGASPNFQFQNGRASERKSLHEAIQEALEGRAEVRRVEQIIQEAELMAKKVEYTEALEKAEAALRYAHRARDAMRIKLVALCKLRRWEDGVRFCEKYHAATKPEEIASVHDRTNAFLHIDNNPHSPITVINRMTSIEQKNYIRCLRYTDHEEDALAALEAIHNRHGHITWVSREVHRIRAIRQAKEAGDAAFKERDYHEALAQYAEALKLDLDWDMMNAVLHCNRGAAHMALRRFEQAHEDCTAAIRRKPEYWKAYLRRARASRELGRLAGSVTDFEVYIQNVEVSDDIKDELEGVRKQMKREEDKRDFYRGYRESSSFRRRKWAGAGLGSDDVDEGEDEDEYMPEEEETRGFRDFFESFRGGSPLRSRSHRSQSGARPSSSREGRSYRSQYQKQKSKSGFFAGAWQQHTAGSSDTGGAGPSLARPTGTMVTHYTVLGITQQASTGEIRKAYHKMALKFHPDKNQDKGADTMFKKASEAYNTLSDAASRRTYDHKLRLGAFE